MKHNLKQKNQTLELLTAGIIIGFVCGMPIGLGLFSEVANHIESITIVAIISLFVIATLIILIFLFRKRIFDWLKIKVSKTPEETNNQVKLLVEGITTSDEKKIENSIINLIELGFGLISW